MSAQLQAQTSALTLKGSAELVCEFFGYSINNILYQRGIYESTSFTTIKKYGIPIQVTTDLKLQSYLDTILTQLGVWLLTGTIKQLVLVISGIDSENILERWCFNIETELNNIDQSTQQSKINKSQSDIAKEIGALIRQITSSVSFLPLFDEPCEFDLLVYTHSDTETPLKWEESDPLHIEQSQQVKLRSFTTTIHNVNASVAYRRDSIAG